MWQRYEMYVVTLSDITMSNLAMLSALSDVAIVTRSGKVIIQM